METKNVTSNGRVTEATVAYLPADVVKTNDWFIEVVLLDSTVKSLTL